MPTGSDENESGSDWDSASLRESNAPPIMPRLNFAVASDFVPENFSEPTLGSDDGGGL